MLLQSLDLLEGIQLKTGVKRSNFPPAETSSLETIRPGVLNAIFYTLRVVIETEEKNISKTSKYNGICNESIFDYVITEVPNDRAFANYLFVLSNLNRHRF